MFYRCDRVDLWLISSKQKLVVVCRVLPSRPGNRKQSCDSCAQCDTRRTVVSLAPTAGETTLCDLFDGKSSRAEGIKPHRSFSYVKNCVTMCNSCVHWLQLLRSASPLDSEGIFPPLRDENEEPSSIGFSRHRAAACLHDGVKSPTRTIDWKKNTIFLKWIVYLMVALYNH